LSGNCASRDSHISRDREGAVRGFREWTVGRFWPRSICGVPPFVPLA